jgi:hypothetical protein
MRFSLIGGLLGNLFYRSLQILALLRLLKREIFALSIIAEVWAKRKSIGRYFWDPRYRRDRG